MIGAVRKIYALLSPKERRQAGHVWLLTIIMAFLEMVGIVSILPFIAVLTNPEIVTENEYLRWGYETFEFETPRSYLFAIGLAVFIMLFITNAVKALGRWMTLRFSIMTGHSISIRLFQQYLHQPYSFFLQRNSSDLRKSVLGEVQGLVNNVILPLMNLAARFLLCLAILLVLFLNDPLLALGSFAVIGGVYAVIYLGLRKWLLHIGKERLTAQGERFKVVNDVMLGIKNVKLTAAENTYVNLYSPPSLVYSKTSALSGMASELPRYCLEVVAFGGILGIILYQLLLTGDVTKSLPTISLYVLAGYRLMPNFQAAFSDVTKIRFNSPVLDKTVAALKETSIPAQKLSVLNEQVEPMPFKKEIVVEDLGFSYAPELRQIFKGINLSIPVNSSLGIVGATGMGKTTLVDLMLGLLSPTEGRILIDGTPLNDENRRAWQANTAYVTQQVYLSDDTLRNNIAFGIEPDAIDEQWMQECARMAALSDFVAKDLPHGYDSIIGENGIRLSGGQRQRIALARSLYLDRPVLVLDEATSSLDYKTEDLVMQAINELGQKKTIIIIAHRLKSLEKVDQTIDMSAYAQKKEAEALLG